MAFNFKISGASADAAMDAFTALLDGGVLRIYEAAQPAGPDTALSGQKLLAELTLNATAFGPSSGGIAAAAAITKDSSANDTGTAAWYRAFMTDGTTAVCDGSIGTAGCDLNLNSTAIQANAEVSITSWTLTLPLTA